MAGLRTILALSALCLGGLSACHRHQTPQTEPSPGSSSSGGDSAQSVGKDIDEAADETANSVNKAEQDVNKKVDETSHDVSNKVDETSHDVDQKIDEAKHSDESSGTD